MMRLCAIGRGSEIMPQRLIFRARRARLARQWPGVAAALPEFGASSRSWRRTVAGQQVHDLTPDEVAEGIAEGRYLLVDVREPNEVEMEAYPDAVVVPLSSFNPAEIPEPAGREVVFACRSGKRSVTASLAAQAAGLPYDKHLAGGMLAWKAAGLPLDQD
jgi:rhodanese-related sulfurtransferase